ncbi:MAG: hypothetical protein M1827_001697 [Pycnora praestabilis]|nr:MAG: hypothetical protein M1827_001697 [Pycnora praestabilis]
MAAFLAQIQPPISTFHNPHLPTDTPPEERYFSSMDGNHHPPQPGLSMDGNRNHSRMSSDYRNVTSNGSQLGANGNNALPVPSAPQNHNGNGQPRNMTMIGGVAGFEGPRSPPGNKNTSHVPCKFFRQGACQAGKACPFLHTIDTTFDVTPCKYFAKGNCKFGAKCALAHVLPDGRRVNRPHPGMGGGHLNLGGRVNPPVYHNQDSALANSLLLQQANKAPISFSQQYHFSSQDDFPPITSQQNANFDSLPTIDTGLGSSHPGSKYGSPRDDIRSPLSPLQQGLSTLDAPLPASFDSQGISWMARHGPVAASVPSKFGLDSPPPSLSHKVGPPSDALKNLHDSAFGNDSRSNGLNQTSSPPPGIDEYYSPRTMHSQRVPKPKIMSASLPRAAASGDWDEDWFEEDFIPNSLHELLTPQEKMRRFSRTEEDPSNPRQSLSGFGTPGESSSKVGSPSTSSPSRFGALFARQQSRRDDDTSFPITGFGHVGSPLRNSSLHPGASPNLRAVSRPTSGDVSPFFATSPRQFSMSMISQQLQRTRLSRAESSESGIGLHPGFAAAAHRHSVGGGGGSAMGVPNGRLDRAVSSSSIGNSRIDEEQGDFVFSMEEEEDTKRYSGGWNYPTGGRSPRIGPIAGVRHGVGAGSQEAAKALEGFYGNGT